MSSSCSFDVKEKNISKFVSRNLDAFNLLISKAKVEIGNSFGDDFLSENFHVMAEIVIYLPRNIQQLFTEPWSKLSEKKTRKNIEKMAKLTYLCSL